MLNKLVAISQNVIVNNKDTLICLPLETSKKIIYDLEEKDYCFKQLEIMKNDTFLLNRKIYFLNSEINILNTKDEVYKEKILKYKTIDSLKTENFNILMRENKKIKVEKNILVGGMVVAFAIPIIILFTRL
jgi:hypothetical protein